MCQWTALGIQYVQYNRKNCSNVSIRHYNNTYSSFSIIISEVMKGEWVILVNRGTSEGALPEKPGQIASQKDLFIKALNVDINDPKRTQASWKHASLFATQYSPGKTTTQSSHSATPGSSSSVGTIGSIPWTWTWTGTRTWTRIRWTWTRIPTLTIGNRGRNGHC